MKTSCVLLVLSFCEGRTRKKEEKICFLHPLAVTVEEMSAVLGAVTSVQACLLQESTLSHTVTQLRWRLVLLFWDSFTPAAHEHISSRSPAATGLRTMCKVESYQREDRKCQLFSWSVISQLGPIAKSWHNTATAYLNSFLLSLVILQLARTLGIKEQFLLIPV